MNDESLDATRAEDLVVRGGEQLLDAWDAEDLRASMISLRDRRRTHAGGAILCTVVPAYALLRVAVIDARLLVVLATLLALAGVELWLAVSAHRKMQDADRLLAPGENVHA